ncbi:hypothetical protein RJ640_005729 [Escallonia rubra]|uniref:Uncharacterized protein n=1 Tax=Escallonia rubra TaxID=112253 RepID=A0AA88RMT1_9ASTE|nr:hypothetical protein RJ640_005729 [Escallonia rubra]
MEEKKQLATQVTVCMLLVMLLCTALPALACPSDGGECRNCIVNRMQSGCPGCVPIMRCMARSRDASMLQGNIGHCIALFLQPEVAKSRLLLRLHSS